MRRTSAAAAATALALAACAGADTPRPRVEATGAPTVRVATIGRHAEQFDGEIGARPAGSQNEQAASVYIAAHLQDAGYVLLLDAVPVAAAVRATNVVARPPGGGAPRMVVAAAYDTPEEGAASGGENLGLLLELARALRVAVPDHSVTFAALAADHTEVGGGHLGSRRLARTLADDDADPVVVILEGIGAPCVAVDGSARVDIEADAAGGCPRRPPETESIAAFEAAGFEAAAVWGPAGATGPGLLEFLKARGR